MLSVIIPTYCEAANVRPLVQRIRATLDSKVDYEVVFVDDNSPDEIVLRVEELSREGAPIRVIVRKNERGLSSAVIRGFQEARGDLLLCMDADLSHPPESILEMLQALAKTKADMVVGSRLVQGGRIQKSWGFYRSLNSWVARMLARPLTSVRDNSAGFFLLPRPIFERARDVNPVGYKIALELIVKCPCRLVVEIPIYFADRQFGESKLNLREQVNYLLHLKRLYDYRFGKISQLIQFCLVGASGVIVNLLCYALLLKSGLSREWGYGIAIWLAMTWNFLPNRYLTFDRPVRASFLPQYVRFVLTCLLGAIVNWLVTINLARHNPWFQSHSYLAALVGIAAGTFFNFILSSQWVFRVHQPARL